MLELLNQMDGFSSNEKIKVSYSCTPLFLFFVLVVLSVHMMRCQVVPAKYS
jgi:hypothetical protein